MFKMIMLAVAVVAAVLGVAACTQEVEGTPVAAPEAAATTTAPPTDSTPKAPKPKETEEDHDFATEVYLDVVEEQGIDLSHEQAIQYGNDACKVLADGGNFFDAIEARPAELSEDDAAFLAGAAMAAFCPEMTDEGFDPELPGLG